jgi:hypothetical protein
MRSTYAGVDCEAEKHDVPITDETGEEILAVAFAQDEPRDGTCAVHSCATR